MYEKAKSADDSLRASADALGIDLFELPDWTCCGAAFPLVTDNIMNLVAAARILANARKEGRELTTLCAFCYNVLKRTNRVMIEDDEKRKKICDFIEEEYEGDLKVLHFLEVLRDVIGFENIDVKRKLGMRVAPYYGCKLLEPYEEIQMDDTENPKILEDFLQTIGCKSIDFPYKNECCGSYLVVNSADAAIDCSRSILHSAQKNGAEAIVLSCPLCYFNLDQGQQTMKGRRIPVFYFTELLALALKIKVKLEGHFVDPYPLLESKNII